MDDKESGDGPHADAGENNGAHHNSGLRQIFEVSYSIKTN